MFPFTVVPAYNLPVYASQRPLPDATQDSVRGCSLGFAAAVIADGRLQRACKAQRSSNRTCRSPASGSPTGFTARYTESKPTARGFGTVSNSPSPLDTAISGGACLLMVFAGSSPITTTSPSSKAHQKSGPFAPPALPGLNAPTTLSDSRHDHRLSRR